MHHFVTRFLGMLLALAIVTTAGSWVLERTLWNADYLQQTAADTKLANGLADNLPVVLARTTSNPGETEIMLQQVLTPSFVRDQLETIIPDLIRHYREGGSIPSLDLTGLQSRLTREGFEVPPSLASTLRTPQPVDAGGADAAIMAVAGQSAQVKWVAPLAAAILAGLILLLGGHRRLTALAGALFGGGLGVAILAGVMQLPPSLVGSTLATSPAKELEAPIKTFMGAVAKDQTTMLLWIAGVLGVLAVALVGVHLFGKMFHHGDKHGH